MTWVICVVFRDFNKRRRGGGGVKIFTWSTHFSCAHRHKPEKDHTKKTNYPLFAHPGLRLNGPSGVWSQWRFSNVVLFVILELFHSTPLLSLHWQPTVRGEWCSKSSMSSAHACSNDKVMMLTSTKTFLPRDTCVSRSLDRAWKKGWGAKFLLDQPSLLANMGKSPEKD